MTQSVLDLLRKVEKKTFSTSTPAIKLPSVATAIARMGLRPKVTCAKYAR